MRARLLAVVWLGLGAALWLGIFDLYVSRGSREYGDEHGKFELHLIAEEPQMITVMDRAKHNGVVAASSWAAIVVGLGWATIWIGRPRRV